MLFRRSFENDKIGINFHVCNYILAKNQDTTQKKLFYFVNRHSAELSKRPVGWFYLPRKNVNNTILITYKEFIPRFSIFIQ